MKKLSLLLLVTFLTIAIFPSNFVSAQGLQVSVKLINNLGNNSVLPFTVVGSYRNTESKSELTTGNSYSINVESGNLVLYRNGDKLRSYGKSLIITPTITGEMNSYVYFKGDASYKYPGEIEFIVDGNYVRPINRLPMDVYLKGVVPSEMSDSWGKYGGIEALKAQAVTARTIAKRWISKLGIITDTQSHQVYKGINSTYSYANSAVVDTAGQYLYYGNNLAEPYYSSTNGGTMLSVTNSWGTALSSYPYLTKKADPYSVRANQHLNWSFSFKKQQIDVLNLDMANPDAWWNQITEADTSIMNAIKAKITPSGSQLKIVEIDNVKFTTEPYSATDVLTGSFTVRYFEKTSSGYVKDQNNQLKLLEKTISNRTDSLRGYFGYQGYHQNLRSPNVKSVSFDGTTYTILGNGWGHGIGMSQWGAYYMSKDGQSYRNILDFYYDGTSLKNVIPTDNYFTSLKGDDRYLTSIAVSQYGWKNGAQVVVLGRGDIPVDALTGSVLAKKFNSPLLLTQSDMLTASVGVEISRLNPSKVFILGGEGAISTGVEKKLKEKYSVVRIAGDDRYDTSISIAEQVNNTSGKLILTAGIIKGANEYLNSPDALSIASYAGMNNIPVIYTQPMNKLTEALKTYIKNNNVREVLIIGGNGAVSSGVESELNGLVGSVTRIGGDNRYQTSLNIVKELDFNTNTLFFAQGNVFIDALPGSSLAAALNAPVILTSKDNLPPETASWLKVQGTLPDTFFLGGSGSISDQARAQIRDILIK